MEKKNYYAVAKGKKAGIYRQWYGSNGAEEQVKGFAGALYKSFATLHEAEEWLKYPIVLKNNKNNAIEKSKGISHTQEELDSGKTIIYTDGGALGNPGSGGYGIVILKDSQRKELLGGFRLTTNNRMELTACIVALNSIENQDDNIIIHTDSQYVVNGITKGWAKRWRSNNWQRNEREKAENSDLWAKLLDLCEFHQVTFKWLRGHEGNIENERCDELAKQAASRDDLEIDSVYIKEKLG